MQVKAIPGYEGFYEVSDEGEVFSLWRGKRKKLRPRLDTNGYELIRLCRDGVQQDYTVHRLVLITFVGLRPEGMQCRHLNGVRDDNRLENLKWGTKKEDYADRIRHGTDVRGERNPRAKLTEGWVRAIRCAYSHGETFSSMSEIFKMPQSTIANVVYGHRWSHVT